MVLEGNDGAAAGLREALCVKTFPHYEVYCAYDRDTFEERATTPTQRALYREYDDDDPDRAPWDDIAWIRYWVHVHGLESVGNETFYRRTGEWWKPEVYWRALWETVKDWPPIDPAAG
jgi:hypothetical protein